VADAHKVTLAGRVWCMVYVAYSRCNAGKVLRQGEGVTVLYMLLDGSDIISLEVELVSLAMGLNGVLCKIYSKRAHDAVTEHAT